MAQARGTVVVGRLLADGVQQLGLNAGEVGDLGHVGGGSQGAVVGRRFVAGRVARTGGRGEGEEVWRKAGAFGQGQGLGRDDAVEGHVVEGGGAADAQCLEGLGGRGAEAGGGRVGAG